MSAATAPRNAAFEAWIKAARHGPWHELVELSRASYESWNAGELADSEIEYVQTIIQDRLTHRRRPTPRLSPMRPVRVGARPRSRASLTRRRRAMAFGFLPPEYYDDRRWGVYGVLAIIAEEAMLRGRCGLVIGKIAALAGYCRTTVQDALRHGERMGWLKIERVRRGRRNDPNKVTIASARWRAWLAHKRLTWRGRGAHPRSKVGFINGGATRTVDQNSVGLRPTTPLARAPAARGTAPPDG
jgi:hypothetical protein